MKFTIKKVDCRKPEIVTTLRYLQKLCLPGDELYSVEQGHWWIAYTEDGSPAGFAGMVRSKSWYDCGYMCRAGVVPKFRGNGLQKRLVAAREAQAKRLNWNWLVTDTTDNAASSNSLISCGFKLYDPTIPWAYKHSLYWRKKLNAVQKPGRSPSMSAKKLR